MRKPAPISSNFDLIFGVEDVEAQKAQKHCPRCGSVSLKWASGLPQLWSIYDCQECGYRGSLIVEDGKLAQKIRKRWLKEREERQG